MNDSDQSRQSSSATSGGYQWNWKMIARTMVIAMNATLVLICIMILFASQWKIAELMSHFRLQLFSCSVMGFLFALSGRLPRTALSALVAAVFLGVPICLLYYPSENKELAGTKIKVLCANVLASNHRDTTRFEDMIDDLDPDIIGVIEYSTPWHDKIADLAHDYPYHRRLPDMTGFGIALYSRIPFDHLEVVNLASSDGNVPSIHARLEIDGQLVHLALIHTYSPLDGDRFEFRNEQLKQVEEYLGQLEHPVLVMGDLNCTTWSPYLQRFIANLDLQDSRQGRGIQGSWPAPIWPLLIPIDHVLHSDEISVIERRLESHIGSDHYPMYFEFGVSKK